MTSPHPPRRPAALDEHADARTDDLVIDLTDPRRPRALRGGVEVPGSGVTTATAHPAPAPRRAMLLLLLLASTFTLIDAVATWTWLTAGHAEWNPLLDRLIERMGPGPAMSVRAIVGLTLLGALAGLLDRSALARRGLAGVTVALGAVCAYHGYGLLTQVLLA